MRTSAGSLPEGLRPLPVVGHVPGFLSSRARFAQACLAQPNDVVALRLPGPTLMIKAPRDIRHVLVAGADGYARNPRVTSSRARSIAGEGAFTSSGATHHRQRHILEPVFQGRAITGAAGAVVRGADEVISRWRAGAELDLETELRKVTRRAVVRALFGDLEPARLDALDAAVGVRRAAFRNARFAPVAVPGRLPAAMRPKSRRAVAWLDRELHELIRERRRSPGDGELLSLLTRAGDNGAPPLDDREVRDQVLNLLVVGHANIARALAWACAELLRRPQVEARLRAEVCDVIDSRTPAGVDVPALPGVRALLAETLRLHPPVWMIVRVALRSDRLPGGARVGAGDKVLVSPWVVHRDPRLHLDPERFDPDRFAAGIPADLPRFAYLPFGAGPHVCLGQTLATVECVLVLARLLQRFRFELLRAPDTSLEGSDLRPGPGPAVRVTAVEG